MILNRLKSNIVSFFKRDENKNKTSNKYNEAFFGLVGDAGSGYDDKAKTYIDEGYNVNSIVYSIVNQQARKSASIPFHVKKVEDEQKSKTFLQEIKRKNVTDPQVKILVNRLKKKAFKQEQTFEMPLKKPNVFQSWPEFISLYKTFLKLTGNVYIYMVAPEGGYNKGEPIAFYLLPSHLINIVLKPNANMLLDENPIAFYRLIEGAVFKDFKEENVIHIKYSNPNFSVDGEHLYGQSPLKSALKNIESSNEGMSQNIKTLKNSGAYGFIHGKTTPLQPEQATELKDRLKEMDDNPARLSRIAGVSAEVGFTRLTLTTDELKPFEFLKYDEKQLCNVLGWSDKLLNNDDGSKYKNVEEFRKQVVTDDIMPDLELLERAFNEKVLPRYKKYQNTVIYFDASNLPEMQLDMSTLTSWLTKALKDAVISRAEYRDALNYPASDDPLMDLFTTPGKLNTLEDALKEPEPMTPNSEKKNLNSKAGFDPNQPRSQNGEWSKIAITDSATDIDGDQDYRGGHRVSEEYSEPLHNILEGDMAPRDFYENIHHYNFSGGRSGRESMRAILDARDNPDGDTWIYRAVPPGVKKINNGDWVSLSLTYAKEHASYREDSATNEPWIVLRKLVKIRDVRWDVNDINEMAYFKRPIKKKSNFTETIIKSLELYNDPGDITIKAGFNPNQSRDKDGKWTKGGGGKKGSDLTEYGYKMEKEIEGLKTLFISEKDGKMSIDMIEVEEKYRGMGIGSRIMNILTDIADNNQYLIELIPSVADKDIGTTSRSRLIKFYKRFGFVENKGRNKDFTLRGGSMYRRPLKR